KSMEVVNKVFPNREQIEGFMAPGQDGPIYMLNLLTFKEKAEYPDGRDTDLTGAEAYAVYSAEVAGHLATVGGRPMFAAKVERLMLGEVEELWDTAAIAMYPSRKAMMEMMSSPDYQASAVHRTAGLAGQLNIELVEPMGAWLMQE
ncbi:MAG: DUF1330 domain-containing protein, partial [Pseudomonadales bacterium]|nr:DUF1330 domain-containing protein [Pseudomonadales bacterium]